MEHKLDGTQGEPEPDRRVEDRSRAVLDRMCLCTWLA